jgi:hypothetical protein
MTPKELERNRSAMSELWNFDDQLEDLWSKITNIQRVVTLGNVPIPDIRIITLTLAMIGKTGLLATTTEKFCLRPIDKWTVAVFKAEFQLGNKECIQRLTAGDAGFHGAHNATTPPPALAAAVTRHPLLLTPHLPPPDTLQSKAGKCITVGPMALVHIATIRSCSPAIAKPTATRTMLPLQNEGRQ